VKSESFSFDLGSSGEAATDLTLEEARRIVAEQDMRDPARAIAAVALVLRFEGIANAALLPIAGRLESVADSLRPVTKQTPSARSNDES
jgi:hypothetical protein